MFTKLSTTSDTIRSAFASKYAIFIALIVTIKMVLMALFSSDYQNLLFMHFVNGFVEQVCSGNIINPYSFYAEETNLFPYPPLMFIIESVGGFLSLHSGGNIAISNLFFKLPILAFDTLSLYFLTKLFAGKKMWSVGIYFTSPIILYACYMHGQLDVIPTALLLGALYYLTKNVKNGDLLFIIYFSASILCKLHILAIVPLIFLYIKKRKGTTKALALTGSVALVVTFVISPFYCPAFVQNVVFNHEQSILTTIVLDYVTVKIYLPILALLMVYFIAMSMAKINRSLLFCFCGLLYSIFLCIIPPMPGWYVWIIPFITIFFANMKTKREYDIIIYGLMNIAYLLYFVFAHHTNYVDLYFFDQPLDWLKQDCALFRNGIFTLLLALLLWMNYSMYKSGVASNSLYIIRNRPFTIGIAGDSGSGKSTFLNIIKNTVGAKQLLIIEGDGDHKWERGNAMWNHFTHLNPKSNYLYRQAMDIEVLRSGQSIKRKDYNHDIGNFTSESKISPKPYLALCGLHSLYLPQVRNMLDLKIYMDVDETLRRYWKIKRDTTKRKYNKNEIEKQISSRVADAKHYIIPQKKYADLIISYYDTSLKDYWQEQHEEKLSLKITVNADINIEPMIREIEKIGISVRYDYNENLEQQTVYFESHDLERKQFSPNHIAEKIIPQVEDIAELPLLPTNYMHGILGLTVLLLISYKMKTGKTT